LASGAPPSPFGTAAGFFSTNRTRGTRVPRDPLLEFGSSTELSCVVSARSLPLSRSLCPFSEHGPLTRTMPFFELAGPPLLGFFLPRTPLRRVPLFRRPDLATVPARRGSPVPRRCRPQGLAPLDGSGFARGDCTDPLRNPPPLRGAPTLRGLIPCRSRPFGDALQSFPFPRSRTRSRGPLCFLAGSRSTAASATTQEFSRPLSPSSQLFAFAHPKVSVDA